MRPNLGLTLRSTGPRRQDALARTGKMYRLPQAGPRWPAVAGRLAQTLGLSANPEPIVECTDVRWTESSSERNRRIRLRHVATDSDLVAILVRVN